MRALLLLRSAAPLLGGLMLSLAGCGPRKLSPLEGRQLRYTAQLRVDVRTSTSRPDTGRPPPDPDPAALALAARAHDGLELDMVLSLSPSRDFPDGSLGWLLHFDEVRGRVLRPVPGEAETLEPVGSSSSWELEGRSVELRTFPDGEVLAVDLAEHILGAGRPGELLDLLFPALSPFPPELEVGEEARRTSRWPLTAGGPRGWRHTLYASWINQGQVPEGAGPYAGAWRVTYQGPTEARGADPDTDPPVGVLSSGQLSGELWLSEVDTDPLPLRVLRHGLSWTRSNEIEYPGAVGGPLRVLQEQQLDLVLERLPDPQETP